MIINPAYKWAGIALAVVIVLAGLMLQRSKIADLKDEVELHKAAVKGYEDAQIVNLDVIDDLRKRISDMVEANRLAREAALAAVDAADKAERETAAKLAATNKELARVYANVPSARAWANTGVDAAVLGSLPNRARSD